MRIVTALLALLLLTACAAKEEEERPLPECPVGMECPPVGGTPPPEPAQ